MCTQDTGKVRVFPSERLRDDVRHKAARRDVAPYLPVHVRVPSSFIGKPILASAAQMPSNRHRMPIHNHLLATVSLPDWLVVVIMGIIEGITEFLPISSTGHLLIAQAWLPAQSDVFNVVIQSGAVIAVLFIFKERSLQMFTRWQEPETRDYILKMTGAFMITAVGGLALKAMNFELPETAQPVAIALIVGGMLFIWLERRLVGRQLSDDITWRIAILIGVGQLIAALHESQSTLALC